MSSGRRSAALPVLADPHCSETAARLVVSNEAAAVLLGSNPELLHKRAPEAVWITKTHGIGDVFNRATGGRQPFARFIEPQSLYERRRSAVEFALEAAGKLPRAEIDALGQRFHGEVLIEVSHYPGREIGETTGGLDLKFQGLGILLLPPGRFTYTTSSRATERATGAPKSSSMSASARSIPAVIPAEV